MNETLCGQSNIILHTSAFYSLFSFINPGPYTPVSSSISSSIMQARDGFLYGTTMGSDISSNGAFFQFDLSTNLPKIVHRFSSAVPRLGVIQHTNGNLYDTDVDGVFWYNITSGQFSSKPVFSGCAT